MTDCPPVTGRPGWCLFQSPRCRTLRFTGKFVGRLCLAAPPSLAPPGIATDTRNRTAPDRPSPAFFDLPPAQTKTAGFEIPPSVIASASSFRGGAQVRGGDDGGTFTSGKHRVIMTGSVRGGGHQGQAGDESRAALPDHPPIPAAISLTTRNGHRERLEPAIGWFRRWSPAATNVGIHVAAGLQVAVQKTRCRPLTCNSLVRRLICRATSNTLSRCWAK